MKNQTVITLIAFLMLAVGCPLYLAAADNGGSESQSGILVYSYSHGSETESESGQGVLQIGITALEPVTRIRINDETIAFKQDTRVDIRHPYELEPGRNEFLVTVQTANSSAQERYVIYLGEKPKPEKPGFRLIGILGTTYVDNVSSATDSNDKRSASKASLILVPIYRLLSGSDSELNLKGIVLREKYDNDDFVAYEISYTKMALEWKLGETLIGNITAETGVNDIRTENDNPLLGETESAVEAYLSGMIAWKLGSGSKLDGKLDYTIKDARAETSDPDLDADAASTGLRARYHFEVAGIKGTGKLSQEVTDAKGKYKDATVTKAGIKLVYPFDSFKPALSYDYKIKTMAIANPLYGDIRPEDKLSTWTLQWGAELFKNGTATFKLKMKEQTSNQESSEYSVNEAGLSYMHVF